MNTDTLNKMSTIIDDINESPYSVQELLSNGYSENGITAKVIVMALNRSYNGSKIDIIHAIYSIFDSCLWEYAEKYNDGCLPVRITRSLEHLHNSIEEDIVEELTDPVQVAPD